MRIIRGCLSGLRVAVALLVVLPSSLSGSGSAQESRSSALAQELTQLMQQRKLDRIAARQLTQPDQSAAALLFPGQLLVVSARYPAPALLNEKLGREEYRDVYIDLNSGAVADSRALVSDLGANGLKARREQNQPFDSVDARGKSIHFDGSWREDKMSEEDYLKAFADADEAYAETLQMLVSELRKAQ